MKLKSEEEAFKSVINIKKIIFIEKDAKKLKGWEKSLNIVSELLRASWSFKIQDWKALWDLRFGAF